jgi:hypothetical protein
MLACACFSTGADCQGPPAPSQGAKMSDFFPQDGNRISTFNYEDPEAVDWQLLMEKTGDERIGERTVSTWEFSGPGGLMGAYMISVAEGDAVQVHGMAHGADPMVTFDPPLDITDDDDRMGRDESIESSAEDSDGNTLSITSTYLGTDETCPNTFNENWEDCGHLVIDDGDGDNNTGPIFTGEWIMVTIYGPARLHIPSPDGEWDASKAWVLDLYEQPVD